MARVKYGPIIADISGSVGSATFQKSLYGNTLRNRPRNTRAGTPAQLQARSLMIQCQYAWRALDSATRKQWNQFVAFSGQSINRDRNILTTGHALFLKWNYARFQAGLAIVSVIVYKSAPAWPALLSICVSGASTWYKFTADIAAMNVKATIFASPARNPSWSYTKEGLRRMHVTTFTTNKAYFVGYYLSVFGRNYTVGETIHYKIQFWSTISPILSSIQTGSKVVTSS